MSKHNERVFVIGVGMTKFEKPGAREGWDYPQMVKESGTKALEDAGIGYDRIEQVHAGYVYGDSTCGERAVYELGMTGIPITNVNNNCSTGSTALYLSAEAIRGGRADCVMAVGFEKMEKGSLKIGAEDREQPLMKHMMALGELYEFVMPPAPYMFGAAGREHMEKYGSTPEHFAKIGEKNHRHSANNPYAQFQDVYTLQEILDAKMVYPPLTRLQCSPTSDGSGAAVLASEEFCRRQRPGGPGDRDRRADHRHRPGQHLHRRHRRRPRRLRHDQGGRPPGVRAGRPGHRRLSGDRAARLLLDQRNCSPTRRSAWPPRAKATS
jgi:acetyl-CoA acyltransferase